MTEPTREQMRADLARAMGWKEGSVVWFSPDNGNAICVEDEPPDPFTSAVDKDALVKWICKDIETLRQKFIAELCGMVGLKQNWQLDRYDEYDLMILLTAPLETVAFAAWRAIQEK